MPQHEFDVVVVGGGTSGVVVASRLSRAGLEVCLLEAGGSDRGVAEINDLRRSSNVPGTSHTFDMPIEPEPGGNELVRYRPGRVLGGSSSVNGAIALPPARADLRRWEQDGATGWGPAGTAAALHSVRQTVTMAPVATSLRHPAARAFVVAGEQAGLPAVDLDSGSLPEGVGWLPLTARGSIRQSSAAAYLHSDPGTLRNLTVRTDTSAERLIMADGRVLGAHAGGARYLAREEVILCCGALGTPKLLMLSGIGPADELRSMSIEVAVDLPAVGRHLSDHPEAVLILAPARATPPCAVHGWEAGAFVRSTPATAEPDVVLHFATVPHDANVAGHGYRTARDAMTVSAFVARPLSRGRLHLRSADPAVGPVVAPGFFTDRGGSDIATLAAGLAVAREIVRQPALRPWIAAELAPPGSGSGEELTRYVRKTAGTMFHPAGTCRMGPPGSGCVVTPDLRVDGVDGVRIADASIFPEMVSVNPCVTCLMIGEKCAELVLGDLGVGS